MATEAESKCKEPIRQFSSGKRPSASRTECLTALRSPVRREILRWLHEVGEARSPAEFAKHHRHSLGDASYHFKVLRQCGVVGLTDAVPVRGALKHFYASTVTEDAMVTSFLTETEEQDRKDWS